MYKVARFVGHQSYATNQSQNHIRTMPPSRSQSPFEYDLISSVKKIETSVTSHNRSRNGVQHELADVRKTTTDMHLLLLESFAHTLQRDPLTTRLAEIAMDIDDAQCKLRPLSEKDAAAKAAGTREALNEFLTKHSGAQRQLATKLEKLRRERRLVLAQISKLDDNGTRLANKCKKILGGMESIRTAKHLI